MLLIGISHDLSLERGEGYQGGIPWLKGEQREGIGRHQQSTKGGLANFR